MTIEQLVGRSADELEAMTQVELENYFAPYLQFVRPTEDNTPRKVERMAVIGNSQRDKEARLQKLMDMIPD